MEQHEQSPRQLESTGYDRDDGSRRDPGYRYHDLPYKSPAFTVILSMFPGLGQIYLGYYRHGFLYAMIFASTVAALASGAVAGMEPLFGVFLAFFILFQLVDAWRKAVIYNQILARGEAMDLSEGDLPNLGGSMFTGVALTVIGLLILANTVLDVSMAWVRDWWPVGLVAVGVWLIVQSRRERNPNR